MKRVSKILFPVDVDSTLAPATMTPDQLRDASEGGYLVVDPVTGLEATATASEIEIIVKCGDGIVSSGPIKKGKVSAYSRSEFATSIARIQTTGTLPTPVVGTEYVIYIAKKEDDNYFLPRKRFAVVATAAMVDATALGDAFVSLIEDNAGGAINNELGLSVANAAGVLTFTGVDSNSATPMLSSNVKFAYESLFEVVLADNLEGVALTRTAEPDKGCGEGSEVRKLEEIHKGYLGHLNNVTFSNIAYGTGYIYKSAFATDYDLAVIEYDSPFNSVVEGNTPFQESIVLASVTGDELAGFPAASGALAVMLETTLDLDSGSWS